MVCAGARVVKQLRTRTGCSESWFDVQMCSGVEDLHLDEELIELD